MRYVSIDLCDQKTFNLLETYINKTRNESNDFLFPGKHSLKPLSEQSVRFSNKRESLNKITFLELLHRICLDIALRQCF